MKRIFTVFLLIIMVMLTACSQKNDVAVEGVLTKDKLLYHTANTENSILFVFDYSCPWCTLWQAEIFPLVKAEFIDSDLVSYATQSIAKLNATSEYLMKMDYITEKKVPELHYQIQDQMILDSGIVEDWGTESYVKEVFKQFGVDLNLVDDPKLKMPDFRKITMDYHANGVEYIPTVFVNGDKMDDPFDLDEMRSKMK